MTSFSFLLMGKIPSKKNSKNIVWLKSQNRRIVVANKDYQIWEKNAIDSLKKQSLGVSMFPLCRAAVEIEIWYPDNVGRDNTNIAEGVMDALVRAGVIVDDKWQICPIQHLKAMGIDRKDPRAVVRVTPMEA